MTQYIKLSLETKLTARQEMVILMLINSCLNQKVTLETDHGIDDFPFAYLFGIAEHPKTEIVNRIAELLAKIYPKDFEFELLGDVKYDGDCEIEIDDGARKNLTITAMRQMHNRWVDKQISEGWRFGMKFNCNEKVDPRLQNWDALLPSQKVTIDISDAALVALYEKNYK
jgi:hypothetical protein